MQLPSSWRWRSNRSVIRSSGLYSVAVNSLRWGRSDGAQARFVAALEVDVFDVEGVDVAGKVPKNRQEDVDQQICPAASG